MHKKNKKWLIKVEMFCQQIRQGPYLICTVYRRSHYNHSVRLFEHEKYILTAQLHCPVRPVRSLDEKIYIFDTCYKHISGN